NDPNIPAPPGGSHGTNGIFYFTDSTGNSVYHGVTLQAIEKAGKYFSLNANYTLSHTLDDGTFVTFVSTPQSNAQRNLERANSNQDARHRFVANFTADAPQSTFLRNFQLSSIVTLQSASPFTARQTLLRANLSRSTLAMVALVPAALLAHPERLSIRGNSS